MRQRLSPPQGVFYKDAMPGPERAARLKDLLKQLDLVESLLLPAGPYCTGDAISFADVVLYPTVAMMQDQAAASLVGSVTEGRPKLAAWLAHCNADPRFRGVADKIKAFVDTFLGKAAGEPAVAMMAADKAYQIAAKALPPGTKAGPPHTQMWAAMVEALVSENLCSSYCKHFQAILQPTLV